MIALDAVRPLNQIPKKAVKPVKMQMGGTAIQDLACYVTRWWSFK
jgi:hypothetical protein